MSEEFTGPLTIHYWDYKLIPHGKREFVFVDVDGEWKRSSMAADEFRAEAKRQEKKAKTEQAKGKRRKRRVRVGVTPSKPARERIVDAMEGCAQPLSQNDIEFLADVPSSTAVFILRDLAGDGVIVRGPDKPPGANHKPVRTWLLAKPVKGVA